MFKLNLVIRRKNEDIMIFSPSPLFRVLFLIVAAVMISGMVISVIDDNKGSFILPCIIAAICIIAAFYEESWTFDKKDCVITRKTGLLFFHKMKKIPFKEIDALELTVLIRGGRIVNPEAPDSDTDELKPDSPRKKTNKKYYQILQLNLKSGENIIMETFEGYNTDNIIKKAWILSDFCGFRFVK